MSKEHCITLNRVSSSDQKDTGYSLPAQKKHSREYANEQGFEIFKEFTFQESASKVREQKKFNEILNEIDRVTHPKTGIFKLVHLIVEKPDRLGRLHSRKEAIFDFIAQKRVILHYYKENKIFDDEITPQDILGEDVMTSMNKYVALNIGRESKKGTLQKAEEGWLPHKPPVGYYNNPDKKHPTAILVREEERSFVIRLFELRGNDFLSYQGITEKLREENLVPARYMTTFRKSSVEKWLKNPFFGGKFSWRGKLYTGKHELIVSRSLYKKVQEAQTKYGRPVNNKHQGTFSNMFVCGECGCKISYHPKKKGDKEYHLYICANGKKKHETLRGMYKSEGNIMEAFESDVLNRVSITAEFASRISDAMNKNHEKLQARLRREEKEYRERKAILTGQEDEYYEDNKSGKLSLNSRLNLQI